MIRLETVCVYTDSSGHLVQSFVWLRIDLSAVDEKCNAAVVEVLEVFFYHAWHRDDSTVIELRHTSAFDDHRCLSWVVLAANTVLHLHAFVVTGVVYLSAAHCHLNNNQRHTSVIVAGFVLCDSMSMLSFWLFIYVTWLTKRSYKFPKAFETDPSIHPYPYIRLQNMLTHRSNYSKV